MPNIKLTQRSVSAAKGKAVRYDLWDDELSGFGLRVASSGVKTFIVRYRANGGGRRAPRRFLTLGKYGVLTADQARLEARKVLASVQMGGDPAHERSRARLEMTVAELIGLYEAEGTSHLKPRTATLTLARLKNHILPTLGKLALSDVRPADIDRMARAVEAGKTKSNQMAGPSNRHIVSGGAGVANKVVRDLSAVFTFAAREELIERNPCALVKKRPDGRRTRTLDMEEMRSLCATLNEIDAGTVNPKAIAIVWLLVLTGCRREEVAALRWEEVDLVRGALHLTDTKTGRSYRPLSVAAVKALSMIERGSSPFVFPAERGEGSYSGLKKAWPRIMHAAGLKGVTPHTLRHTLASLAASSGESLLLVGALLGHSNARSTSIYAHLTDNAARAAADRVGRLLPTGAVR